MTDQLPDTWHGRDLPVLRAIVARLTADPRHTMRSRDIADELHIDEAEARAAVVDLIRSGHVLEPPQHVRRLGYVRGDVVGDITEPALRDAGAWPTPESALDRMITALQDIAEHTDNDDTRSRARKILDELTGAGKAIGISIAAAAITGQLPH